MKNGKKNEKKNMNNGNDERKRDVSYNIESKRDSERSYDLYD